MKIPPWQSSSLAPPRSVIRAAAGHTARLAVAALLVACGDNITGPSASRSRAIPVSPKPDIVIMERTTDIAAHDGIAAVRETSTQTLTAQVRIAGRSQPSATEESFDPTRVPAPPTSLAARYETAICSALPSWTRSMKAGGMTGAHIEMTGVGDAPASTIRVIQDGQTVATVERRWLRTATTWQLEHQVTTSGDGVYRDVVTYRRLNATTRNSVRNAIPVVGCGLPSTAKGSSPEAMARSYYAPRAGLLLAPNGGATSYTDGCAGSFGGDPCYAAQLDVYEAQAAVAVLSAVAAAACTPAGMGLPLKTAACASAMVAYGLAVSSRVFAEMKLQRCREEQAAKKCSCGGGGGGGAGSPGIVPNPFGGSNNPYITGSPAVGPDNSRFGGSSAVIGAPGGSERSFYDDCDSSGGGGGTGGGGGGGGGNCSYQVWEISYDGGRTWEYWGTFWTCEQTA